MFVAERTRSLCAVILCISFSFLWGGEAAHVRRQTGALSPTALVIASSASAADEATTILNANGQQSQLLVMSEGGSPLPALETTGASGTVGNFGLIVIVSLASFDYGGTIGWASAISADQWTTLYTYQSKYGVRMVHLDGYPGNFEGTAIAPGPGGCCSSEDQTVQLLNTSLIPASGQVSNSTLGLWHYPAVITDFTTTAAFLEFNANSEYPSVTVAGVIQNFTGREQMVFFLTGASWSATTNYLGRVWFDWGYQQSPAAISPSTTSQSISTSSSVSTGSSIPTTPPAVVSSPATALVIASSASAADEAVSILNAYDQPSQLLVVPQNGTSLPPLETIGASGSVGNFGLIIVIGMVSYNYGGTIGWASAITTDQWTALSAYQSKYRVRMIHLDGFPGNFPGTSLAPGPGGCCSTEDQNVYVVDASLLAAAGLQAANLSTLGLWHYPATITDATTTTDFLRFAPNTEYVATTVAGVVQNFGGREQMVFFLTGGSWSSTTNYLNHIWFQWGYQGLSASTTSTTSSSTTGLGTSTMGTSTSDPPSPSTSSSSVSSSKVSSSSVSSSKVSSSSSKVSSSSVSSSKVSSSSVSSSGVSSSSVSSSATSVTSTSASLSPTNAVANTEFAAWASPMWSSNLEHQFNQEWAGYGCTIQQDQPPLLAPSFSIFILSQAVTNCMNYCSSTTPACWMFVVQDRSGSGPYSCSTYSEHFNSSQLLCNQASNFVMAAWNQYNYTYCGPGCGGLS